MRRERYIVRADGNAEIGAGHLMRCLSIMEALAKLLGGREEILFLCADEQSARLVEKKGFPVKTLYTDYRFMETEIPVWEELFAEELHEREDIQASAEKKQMNGPDVCRRILVDSYYVTDAYLEKLRGCGRVFLIDDMQRRSFPADAVINYNIFAERESYEALYAGTNTELYIGSSFVPLRRQFEQTDFSVSEAVKSVLITTGGGDKDNIAGQILKCIYREDMEFHVVAGQLSPCYEELKRLAKQRKEVILHHDVQDMAGLMESCDLAVTAGGSTVYELASVGVPFICFSYAENQERLVRYLGEQRLAGEAGAYHKNKARTLENIKKIFECLCDSRKIREEYSKKEQKLVDGMGAMRLAEALKGSK